MCALIYSHTTDEARPGESPSRATRGSVGLDLFMPSSVTVGPGETAQVDLKMTFVFPPKVYGQLHLRSSSSLLGISLLGGVIGETEKSPSSFAE
jgi:dUTPase